MSMIRFWLHGRTAILMAMVAVMITTIAPISAFADDGLKVSQIVVTGNQNINKDTISNILKLSTGMPYNKDMVEKDRSAINGLGYFSAVSAKTENNADGVCVVYDVVENPLVKEIKIEGSGPIKADKIVTLMKCQPNQVLNTLKLQDDIETIQNYYRNQGYVAYVTEDIDISPEKGVLTIPILVHTVESIEVVGNKKTKEYVFTREMKTKPGQVFNMMSLRDDIARVYNLDYLEDIQTPKIEPGSQVGKVKIAIPVTEKKTGNVSVGLGYSNRSRLVGRAELAETNFRGRGQGLTAMWETGTSGGIGGSSSYELGFHEPWIDQKNTSLSVNVFNKLVYRFSSTMIGGGGDIDGQTYDERRKGASLGLSRPLSNFTRAFLTFRGEYVDAAGISDSNDTQILPSNGNIKSGTFRLLNNTRDYEKDPAAGWYKSVSFELGQANVVQQLSNGTTPINGPFTKLQFDIRHYWSKGGRKTSPNDKRTTIAARLIGGVATGKLPFYEQFFTGGADSVRGYREDRFWGDKMFVASVEYRKPIAQAITGVVFVDYGDAWGSPEGYNLSSLPQHNGFNPVLGTGVGLRMVTPIGNLRIDYGIGSEGAKTYFSIGQAF